MALNVIPDKRPAPTPGRFSMASATVQLRAYDTSTGRILGSSKADRRTRTKTTPTAGEWIRALGGSAEGATAEAVGDLVPSIVQAAVVDRDLGTPFHVVLTGLTEAQVDRVLDGLESDTSFRGLRELTRQPGFVEVELFSADATPRHLNRRVREVGTAAGDPAADGGPDREPDGVPGAVRSARSENRNRWSA